MGKHGRIAMIATIGYVVPEKFGTFGDIKLGGDVKFSDVPNGVQALFKIPAVGLLQILLLIGILETQFPNENGDYGTGYFASRSRSRSRAASSPWRSPTAGSRCSASWACSRRTSSRAATRSPARTSARA